MSRIVVPISLGGSEHKGLFCPPVRERTMLDTIPALLSHYRVRYGRIDEVRFFHGGTVSSKALSFCTDIDWRVSTHPLDCSRSEASRYVENKISAIEFDVMSLCDDVLSRSKCGYTVAYVQQLILFFNVLEVAVVLVLPPVFFVCSF